MLFCYDFKSQKKNISQKCINTFRDNECLLLKQPPCIIDWYHAIHIIHYDY
jgi:hypothetical protein